MTTIATSQVLAELSAEEISDLRQSLEFDRDRVGMAGCAIRKRAAFLLALMDLADNFAVDVAAGPGTCLRCRGSGMEPLQRCNQCGAVREPWQAADETRCPMHAVPDVGDAMITEKERAALWAAISKFILESGGGDDKKERVAARRDVERVVEDIALRMVEAVRP